MSETAVRSFPQVWELASILPEPASAEFRQELDRWKNTLAAVAQQSESLPPLRNEAGVIAQWEALLGEWEKVDCRIADFRSYIECRCAADAQNSLFQQIDAELAALGPLREQIQTNVQLLMRDVSPELLNSCLKASARLNSVAYFLQVQQKMAVLRLPKAEELLAADLAVDGIHAWGRLYDRLCGALRVEVVEHGEIVTKSPGQVLFDSPERSIRENNFKAADRAWQSISIPCAEAINHIAGTRLTLYRRLGLKDHLEAPVIRNRMSRETLSTMWETITRKKPVLQRYLRKFTELLGLKSLTWWDTQAPLPMLPGQDRDREFRYDDACELIQSSFSTFSQELGDFAQHALDSRWIEAENRPGKRQGGFCTGLPTAKESRIFMTYVNSSDSAQTLAHELGHAYHSWVLKDQPYFHTDYPMNLAETASTFAEAVFAEGWAQRTTNRYERLCYLNGMLNDAVAYLMNIHARFLFEDQFHRERLKGEVAAERLSELMVAAQKAAYLDSLDPEGWNPRFWISKLHFYITGLPFYNYPYTFGYLLSQGLFALRDEVGKEFPQRFRQFLILTGCRSAEDSVRESFGFDLREPKFWELSLKVVENRVEEYERLANEVIQTMRTA